MNLRALYFFIGLALLGYSLYEVWLLRLIQNIPTSKIRSLAIGLVEIKGKVKCIKPLNSHQKKKAVGYYELEEIVTKGKNTWLTTKFKWNQFYLEDKTGKVLIDPKEVDFWYETHPTSPENIKRTWIDRFHAIGFKNKKKQVLICEGDELYILGEAKRKRDAKSDVNHENLVVTRGPKKFLHMTTIDESVLINNFNKTTKINIAVAFMLILVSLPMFFI